VAEQGNWRLRGAVVVIAGVALTLLGGCGAASPKPFSGPAGTTSFTGILTQQLASGAGVYSIGSWGREQVGSVDPDGTIYGIGLSGPILFGSVDSDGTIYMNSLAGLTQVGSVDADGTIYRNGLSGRTQVGFVSIRLDA
jgi:hypothetical protein